MASSIELFEFFEEFHHFLGICPSQPNQKQSTFNWKFTIFLFVMIQQICTTAAFLIFEVQSMFDVGFGIYVTLTFTNSVVISLLFIWQKENTFEFIRNCKRFIEKSKYNSNPI